MVDAAFIFPGQGAQAVGLGKDLYENFAAAKTVFDRANEILKIDLKKLCFEGPQDQLSTTQLEMNSVVCSMRWELWF